MQQATSGFLKSSDVLRLKEASQFLSTSLRAHIFSLMQLLQGFLYFYNPLECTRMYSPKWVPLLSHTRAIPRYF